MTSVLYSYQILNKFFSILVHMTKETKQSSKTYIVKPILYSEQNIVNTNLCAVLSSGKKAHHWKCIDMIVRLWVVNLKLTGKLVRFLAYLVDPHHKYWVQILFEGGFIFLCTFSTNFDIGISWLSSVLKF